MVVLRHILVWLSAVAEPLPARAERRSLDELDDDDPGERERREEEALVQANTYQNEAMTAESNPERLPDTPRSGSSRHKSCVGAEEEVGGSRQWPQQWPQRHAREPAPGGLDKRMEELEKELARERQENLRLLKAQQDKDDIIRKLREEIDLLNRDLDDIDDENEQLKQENKTLLKVVGQLTSQTRGRFDGFLVSFLYHRRISPSRHIRRRWLHFGVPRHGKAEGWVGNESRWNLGGPCKQGRLSPRRLPVASGRRYRIGKLLFFSGWSRSCLPADCAQHIPVARGDHGVDVWADGEMSSGGEGTELEDEQLLSSHGSESLRLFLAVHQIKQSSRAPGAWSFLSILQL
ncbi:unnamed protein product [Tetraodon nigroviridis]|uniref:(spotted green pufferfish) hypothetical protein n=1 Tax=Tetraodon nigroviridis TaxID=99883 RepID=Q4S5D9_TETNG|nr:unnamed protein product [Tetraodon nigroviridis]